MLVPVDGGHCRPRLGGADRYIDCNRHFLVSQEAQDRLQKVRHAGKQVDFICCEFLRHSLPLNIRQILLDKHRVVDRCLQYCVSHYLRDDAEQLHLYLPILRPK